MKKSHSKADRAYFQNRELSWLQFNDRVLSEALSDNNPILERAKFLSIFSTNLDEFFMVRVASVQDQILAGYKEVDYTGYKPTELMKQILRLSHELVDKQYSIYHQYVTRSLKEAGTDLLSLSELSEKEWAYVYDYYRHEVYPVLTPVLVDALRPFPLVGDRQINLCLALQPLKKERDHDYAIVQVPSILPRLVWIPGTNRCVFLEEVVNHMAGEMIPERTVLHYAFFRITRNADLTWEEDEVSDLLRSIKKKLNKRKWGQPVRLEVQEGCEESILKMLMGAFELKKQHVFCVRGPLALDFLNKVYSAMEQPAFKYPPFHAYVTRSFHDPSKMFAAIGKRDYLLHHPFESFDPVVAFVKQAATDPNVLAIKQTLYRVSGQSPIVAALAAAARNGKQVTVLVELKARFDEENNIHWAEELDQAGCHVIYGFPGLKTHAKMILVVRRENGGLRRYVHMATGNYNDVTARFYTDVSLFTAKSRYGDDATAFFNQLTGSVDSPKLHTLSAAPEGLRAKLYQEMDCLIAEAAAGSPGELLAKMNALTDQGVIRRLYAASQAGVRVRLVIRGICCLRPGIAGLSENIEVHSVVGRFLEHSRIFCFLGKREKVYFSSADWMPRNLSHRIELLVPVAERRHRQSLIHLLRSYWKDNAQTSVLNPAGIYIKAGPRPGELLYNVQEALIKGRGFPEGGAFLSTEK